MQTVDCFSALVESFVLIVFTVLPIKQESMKTNSAYNLSIWDFYSLCRTADGVTEEREKKELFEALKTHRATRNFFEDAIHIYSPSLCLIVSNSLRCFLTCRQFVLRLPQADVLPFKKYLLILFIAAAYIFQKTLLGQTWNTSSKCYGPETACADLL